MNVDVQVFGRIKGMSEEAAASIAGVFPTYEQVAKATPEQLAMIVEGVDEEIAKAAIAYASIMTATASAEINVEVTSDVQQDDPFATMIAAGAKATQLQFDPEKLGRLAGAMMTYVWDIGGVGDELAAFLNEHGYAFLTDPALSETIDDWLIYKSNGGTFHVGTQRVAILPWQAKAQIWGPITEYLEHSELDLVLRSAAAYQRAARKASHAQRTGGTFVVDLPPGVEDPDTLRIRLERALSEAADMIAGGQIGTRSIKVAGEFAHVVIPAYQNAEVIQSLGVPVQSGADPMNAFLTNVQNPRKHLIAAMNFARAINAAMMHLATYDADMQQEAYDRFFTELSELGQAYALAAAEYAKHFPQPYHAPEGEVTGFKQIAASVMAKIKISIGGATVEVTAQAGAVSTDKVPLYYRGGSNTRLDGESLDTIVTKMLDLFTKEELEVAARHMGVVLSHVADGGNTASLVFNFVTWAEGNNSLKDLVNALRIVKPNFPFYSFLPASDKTTAPGEVVNTGGGAYIGGGISVGGDFVGRDKNAHR